MISSFPAQRHGNDPSYLTSAVKKKPKKVVCFANVGTLSTWLTIMLYQILHEFCVKLPWKSCENEYSHQHLEAVPPRYYVVVPLLPHLFSLPTLLQCMYITLHTWLQLLTFMQAQYAGTVTAGNSSNYQYNLAAVLCTFQAEQAMYTEDLAVYKMSRWTLRACAIKCYLKVNVKVKCYFA